MCVVLSECRTICISLHSLLAPAFVPYFCGLDAVCKDRFGGLRPLFPVLVKSSQVLQSQVQGAFDRLNPQV